MNRNLLTRVPLFQSLPDSELDHLAEALVLQEVGADEIIFREGDPGNKFFIIIYGGIQIIKALGTPEERLIAVRGPGDFIGELSLVRSVGTRTATARTNGQTQLWTLSRSDFDEILHRQPNMLSEMLMVLGERLTHAHDTIIVELQEKNRALQKAYDDLKTAQAQIMIKERMERELQVAHEIQMSILPDNPPDLAGYDLAAYIVPARSVGGDFYDFIPMPDNQMGVIIGDVADKGVPSAIFMAQTRALLYAEATQTPTPKDVLGRVNQHMMRMNESSLFVTVIYGILDAATGQFCYARAGHELPILLDESGKTALPDWDRGQPLGMFEDIAIDQQTIQIPHKGAMLLYTDGMADCRNPQGEPYGIDRIREKLEHFRGISAQAVCENLYQSLVDFEMGVDQYDDVTLVAIHSQR